MTKPISLWPLTLEEALKKLMPLPLLETQRTCPKCRQTYPLTREYFYKSRGYRSSQLGWYKTCIACHKKGSKAGYQFFQSSFVDCQACGKSLAGHPRCQICGIYMGDGHVERGAGDLCSTCSSRRVKKVKNGK